jgi:hypothetical protein
VYDSPAVRATLMAQVHFTQPEKKARPTARAFFSGSHRYLAFA